MSKIVSVIERVNSEMKAYSYFFCLYFLAIAIAKLYDVSIIHPNAMLESISTILQNPLFLCAVLALPITIYLQDEATEATTDRIMGSLLISYAVGTYTADSQYHGLIMTDMIIKRTLISGIMATIFVSLFLCLSNYDNNIKYVIGIMLSSLIIYITKINLGMYYSEWPFLSSENSINILNFLGYHINFYIARTMSKKQ